MKGRSKRRSKVEGRRSKGTGSPGVWTLAVLALLMVVPVRGSTIVTPPAPIHGPWIGNGMGITNVPPPGYIWKNLPRPQKQISSWGRWGCSANITADQYIQWVTNSVTQLMLLGIPQSGGIDSIRFEDPSTTNGVAWTRDGSGGLTLQNGFTVAKVQDMIQKVHLYSGGLIKIYGYFVTSATSTTAVNCGNPTTTLATMARDISTNIFLGFDGIVMDMQGVASDLTSETVRQGNRIANQVIFDYDQNQLQGGVSNRAPFIVIRSLCTNSIVGTVGNLWSTYENKYELNGIGLAGYYYDYTYTSNVVAELNDVLSYSSWAVGPGHYVEWGGWDWSGIAGKTLSQLQNRTIINATIVACSTMSLAGGNFGATNSAGADSLLSGAYDYANAEINSIWNDSASIPGWQFQSFCYVRPLGGYGSLTNFIYLANTNTASVSNFSVSMSTLGYSPSLYWSVRDPWSHTTYSNFQNSFTFQVAQTNGVGLLITPFWPLVAGLNASNSPIGMAYPANSWVLTSTNGAGGTTNNVPTLSLWGNGPDGSQWANRVIISSNNLAFDLNQVGGMVFRYDPENNKLQIGGAVSAVTDSGPFGYNLAVSAGGATAPVCSNSPSILNGRRYIHFSRTANNGLSFSANYSQPVTIFMVMTFPYDQVGASIFDSPGHIPQAFVIGDKNVYMSGGSQINGLIDTNQANWVIATYTVNGASGLIETNGVTVVSGNVGAGNFTGLVIGNITAGNQPASFNLAYVVGFTNMATANKVNVVNWLAARFGLANTNAPITTTVLATQTEKNAVLPVLALQSLAGSGTAPISSNVTTSPYLWTNTLGTNVSVVIAQGTNNGICWNGTLVGFFTNTCTTISCAPNDFVWVTNNGGRPTFLLKP